MLFLSLVGTLASVASLTEAAGYSSYKAYDQDSIEQFNLLKHQGGNGPYSVYPGWGISPETPEECTIEQAHLYVRHGERYPTVGFSKHMRAIFDQFSSKNLTAKNKAYFLNTYKSPAIYDLDKLEQESTEGPYSGYASMNLAGANFRRKYGHLYEENNTLPFFTASQERIVITASNVAKGFLGPNWANYSKFIVLNETEEMGLNSLTPSEGCPNFDGDYNGDYYGKYAAIAFDRSLKKLLADVPGFNITTSDYADLMTLCMHDLNVKGYTPLCEYFSADDWVAYDYFRAIDYYYYSGNGNPTIPALGGLVTDAAIKLLTSPSSPKNGTSLYFNFMHEANILILLTALGVANPSHNLTWEYPDFTSRWNPSELVPMGARFAIEKLSCKNATDPAVKEDFIRMTINDAVFPHDKCTTGPGFSCPMEDFIEITQSRYPSAIDVCGINSTYTQSKNLTFYWDWMDKPETYKVPSNIQLY